jgi:hypothetical protein
VESRTGANAAARGRSVVCSQLSGVELGFGRIVVADIAAPTMLATLV